MKSKTALSITKIKSNSIKFKVEDIEYLLEGRHHTVSLSILTHDSNEYWERKHIAFVHSNFTKYLKALDFEKGRTYKSIDTEKFKEVLALDGFIYNVLPYDEADEIFLWAKRKSLEEQRDSLFRQLRVVLDELERL